MDDYFGYTEKGSSFEGEIRAGVTTFLTMAYILLVNPAMLTVAIGDGTDAGNATAFADVLFATAVAAFIGCVVMGLWANLPFALAPGMGLNAYFVFGVVIGMGVPWQLALFAVFVEGLLFLAMSIPQIPGIGSWRSQMINSIPTDLKIATGAGIGMFLAIIGLREMGWIQDDGATLVNLGPNRVLGWSHWRSWSHNGHRRILRAVGARSRYLNGSADFHSRDDGKRMEGRYDLRHRTSDCLGLGCWSI